MTTQTQPMVLLKGIRKHFGSHEVLKGIDLTVERGKIVSIIGPSGSGKSTLLRSINMLEPPNAGEIWLNGELVNQPLTGRAYETHINAVRQKMGKVFQQFNLFPHLTALQNLTIGPIKLKGVSPAEAKVQAMELLAKVGLADKADAYPARLSGGQKQRVAIARALAMRPQVMLFDEATSALDPELVDEVNLVMKQLAAEQMTMLIVTHEMNFAAEVSDWVLFMEDGLVVEQGPPEQVLKNPVMARTQSFLRKHLAS
ncbi:amino acid ABC transporter ATP-binding protein [Xinfangfangia sp. CPCC 101601]|uniref:Amino acid ABC transporter ATP-binding protein n=1 Tax=Pseudogemmobacter lacusdianii TaxID=3069608 RepID=A0ABU0W2K6_9RHOB|nr:amino acid ABC transporter ATP-binding protein [Xinfangfangia sp. CPCC 101601]MDQ2068138.1 amino acid ABC transporter ATP-binding protein [Xinfangfangia sp. CPCC 101601]